MKPFRWNADKNLQLRMERGITFEQALQAIASDRLLAVIQHPNQEKYPAQRIFIIEVNRYAYLVPFIENDEEIFLKTVIPSRKMTKQYLGK